MVTATHLLSNPRPCTVTLLGSRRQAGQVVGDSPCTLARSGLVLIPLLESIKQTGQVVGDLPCILASSGLILILATWGAGSSGHGPGSSGRLGSASGRCCQGGRAASSGATRARKRSGTAAAAPSLSCWPLMKVVWWHRPALPLSSDLCTQATGLCNRAVM